MQPTKSRMSEEWAEAKRAKKAQRKANQKAKAERKAAAEIGPASRHPEVLKAAAIELLSRGFLNEALARNKKTTRAGDFYSSKQWASVRYAALIRADGRCKCCGASAADGARLHVDHIKPRSKFPELALSLDNMQVLCDMCNVAKSNIDQTNWQAKHKPEDERGKAYREYQEDERRVFRLIKDIAGL